MYIARLPNPSLFLRTTVGTAALVISDVLLADLHMDFIYTCETWAVVLLAKINCSRIFSISNAINIRTVYIVEYVMLFHLLSLFKAEFLLIYSRL